MPVAPEIAVVGLKETRKAFKDFGADNSWRAPLRDVYRDAAGVVESRARDLARQPRPTLAGASATMGSAAIGSIKGKGTTTSATMTAFRGVPYGHGWNFGSKGRFRQFPTKAVPDYNLYAAVADKRDEINETFIDRVGDVIEKAMQRG